MSKPLRGGLPRLLHDHRGPRGVAFRRQYLALVERYGPFDKLATQYAGSVAALFVDWKAAVESLDAARSERERGRGRRPGPGAIRSLQRRAGLAWMSYNAALERLETMTTANRRPGPAPISDLVRREGTRERTSEAVREGDPQ